MPSSKLVFIFLKSVFELKYFSSNSYFQVTLFTPLNITWALITQGYNIVNTYTGCVYMGDTVHSLVGHLTTEADSFNIAR